MTGCTASASDVASEDWSIHLPEFFPVSLQVLHLEDYSPHGFSSRNIVQKPRGWLHWTKIKMTTRKFTTDVFFNIYFWKWPSTHTTREIWLEAIVRLIKTPC